MGIGFRELIVILIMLAVMGLLLAGIVWLVGTASKPSRSAVRTVAERLAELESLKKAGQITDAEYDRQRAVIISSV